MKRLFSILLISYLVLTSLLLILRMQSCTYVEASQRPGLTSLNVEQQYQYLKQTLNGRSLTTGEGPVLVQPALEEDAVERSGSNQDPVKPKAKSQGFDATPVCWLLVPGSFQ
jgi:hypothetical protein